MENKLKNIILDEGKGMTLSGFFSIFQYYMGSVHDKPEIKEMFLDFMLELVKNKELKLARHGNFLQGTPEEQIELFREVWPDEYDENDPKKDIDYFWWSDVAPAGAVWFFSDGLIIWT